MKQLNTIWFYITEQHGLSLTSKIKSKVIYELCLHQCQILGVCLSLSNLRIQSIGVANSQHLKETEKMQVFTLT